jgi:hypothetical protein
MLYCCNQIEEKKTMTPQTYARLMKLLPKLSALTDMHRLKVLAQIDRVLLADEEGATWCDVAERLLAPTITGKRLMDMVAKIETVPTALTESACQFLAQMREWSAAYDEIRLTPRQREWLLVLYDRACVVTEPVTTVAVSTYADQVKAMEQVKANKALKQRSPSEQVH